MLTAIAGGTELRRAHALQKRAISGAKRACDNLRKYLRFIHKTIFP